MNKRKATTLKEIAKKLDISISTASRALNNHPDISDATKEKVQQLAEKLHYSPNLFAQGFRTQRSHILGVIVPNIAHYFTSTILKGILEEAETKGYKVIVSESNNNENKQSEMLRTMSQFGVDGILLALSRKTTSVDSILNTLDTVPLVLFDKVSHKIPCTQVVVDEEIAAFNAVEHLINTGKKRIAIIKETENSFNSEKRFAGYLRALKEHHIEVDKKIILSTEDVSLYKGRMMTNILLSLKERPDAIFAITDTAAIGAIKALHKYNIKIPEEIAVVGFSNSIHATIIQPSLTTVDQPGEKIGKTAVTYLIKEIESNKNEITTKTVTVKTHLIVRDSSFKV
ncbi:LacI family transcriptional regulator [Dokdonia pacifica]|uniref:Transcriptional regulator, LacI family n=1 Tax=Dokdonia pacifica TaxID=1627892 RepID=A0A238VRR7_9FLAO|nr:LacI family DNA-binding transcriptional regulator [Dokdonia pacifica]GGG18264.1 LacI family transcriptional regulator [Dokdonia pacifica]SNR37030.1 transcriptional regulator, LacI family [Dokdonia pacifica]